MARPTNKELMDRIRELEENQGPKVALRVRGILKEIIRHPERAQDLAREALRHV